MKIKKVILADDYKVEKLKAEFGKNKEYPSAYELPILITLSYFPELRDIAIHFVEKKKILAYSSIPFISTIFRNRNRRKYNIILSTYSSKFPKQLLFSALPLNSQVGILGHELSHTIYYLDKSGIELILLGINYLFRPFRITFERNTDKATIDRGFGYQLLDFARYSRGKNVSPNLIKWLDTYYMQPEEIIKYMSKLPEYNSIA